MRQRNVQQQNQATEDEVRRHAVHWRRTPLPPALLHAAAARGVDCATSILLRLDIDFPGMPSLFGTLLTSGGRFIDFEIDTDDSHTTVECVVEWLDVTADQNLNPRNRGIGRGGGAIALRVLHQLNAAVPAGEGADNPPSDSSGQGLP